MMPTSDSQTVFRGALAATENDARHEGGCGSGVIAPLILNLITRHG